MTTTGPSYVAELADGKITEFEVTAADAGLPTATAAELKGGDPEANAAALRDLLDGKPGAYRDIVLYNAAASLIVAGKAADLKAGVKLATTSIDDGHARAALDKLVAITNI